MQIIVHEKQKKHGKHFYKVIYGVFLLPCLAFTSLALTQENSGGGRNYSIACKDFNLTKSKMFAILRAYRCEKSNSFKECQESLNLGPNAILALTSGGFASAASKISSKIRNPDFTFCSTVRASQIELPENFNFMNVFNSSFSLVFEKLALTKGLLGESVSAKCYNPLETYRNSLLSELNTSIKAINKKTNELQKSVPDKFFIEDGSEKKVLPSLNDIQKQVEETQGKLKKINYDPEKVGQLLRGENYEVVRRISQLRDEMSNLSSTEYKLKVVELSRDESLKGLVSREMMGEIRLALISEVDSKGKFQQLTSELNEKLEAQTTLKKIEILKEGERKLKVIETNYWRYVDDKSRFSMGVFDKLVQDIYDTEAYDSRLKLRLDYYSKFIFEDFVANGKIDKIPQRMWTQMSAQDQRRYNMRTQDWKRFVAMGSLPMMRKVQVAGTVLGILSGSAQAGDVVNNVVGAVADASDAGSCSDQQILVKRDQSKNCQPVYQVDEDQYQKLSEASDEELKAVFSYNIECQWVQELYSKYYPQPKISNVNCDSRPVQVPFQDGELLSINENSFSLTSGTSEKYSRVQKVSYDLNPENSNPFQYTEFGKWSKPQKLEQFKKMASPQFQRFSQKLHSATEIMACCQFQGMNQVLPGIDDCKRYGISIDGATSKATFESAPSGQ